MWNPSEDHQYFEHCSVQNSTWKTKFEKVTVIRQSCRYEKNSCLPEVSRSASTAIYSGSSVLLEAVFHFWGAFLNLELIAERNVCFMLMDWADSITRMRLLQLIKLRLGRWARARHSATGGHRSASTTTRHNQNQSRAEKMRWERPSESL